MLPWKLRRRQILPVSHNLLSVYFSPAKFQLVSCNLSLAMIWQMTYTHKLPKLCSATLTGLRLAKKSRATFATNQERAQSHSFRIERVSSAWRRLTVPLVNHSRLDSQTFEYRVSSLENKVSSFETKVLVGGLLDGRGLPCT